MSLWPAQMSRCRDQTVTELVQGEHFRRVKDVGVSIGLALLNPLGITEILSHGRFMTCEQRERIMAQAVT